jgi:hypothetical protein
LSKHGKLLSTRYLRISPGNIVKSSWLASTTMPYMSDEPRLLHKKHDARMRSGRNSLKIAVVVEIQFRHQPACMVNVITDIVLPVLL